MWRHIVLYGMLDVNEKIFPLVECIEGSQTIPIFIIPFQEYSNENIQTNITHRYKWWSAIPHPCIRIWLLGGGRYTQFQSHERLIHSHCDTNNRVPWWASMDHSELVVAPGNWQESAAPACLASSAINVCGTANMRFILFLSIFNTRMWQMYLFNHVCATIIHFALCKHAKP